ncbi:hypothetical protein [Luteolibacter soli]|uniref:Uncharacterized protein n=1 Tax=Luteolibacter soli TaxID=3135280 RepID=A0ABU9AWI0_9BACT
MEALRRELRVAVVEGDVPLKVEPGSAHDVQLQDPGGREWEVARRAPLRTRCCRSIISVWLGLRKFGDDRRISTGQADLGAYRALGAPGFEEKGRFAKEVLGIKDWSEVRHRGPVTGE